MALDVLVVFKSQPRHFCIIEILSPPYLELLARFVIWDFIGLLEENQSGRLATMKGRFTFFSNDLAEPTLNSSSNSALNSVQKVQKRKYNFCLFLAQ